MMQRRGWRVYVVVIFLFGILGGLLWRLVELNLVDRTFLLHQSEARILRVMNMLAHRGMITDRLGSVLALSSPVYSVWINPNNFQTSPEQLATLSEMLSIPESQILMRAKKAPGKEFVYLKRRNPPEIMQAIRELNIPGLHIQEEYQRFYPEGEVAAHVVGLTNVDDHGQEGLELAYDQWLSGKPGQREVLIDRLGNVVADIALKKKPQEGQDLTLSIDRRIQYLAYRILKEQVQALHAKAGTVVVLDVTTGEVLAMTNVPSYNPNNRAGADEGQYRNRAVTDSFEPGSTLKPFTIALALESGQYTAKNIINTNPGRMKVGGYVIKDDLNYGKIDLQQILQKSSNIGAAKILMSLSPGRFWDLLEQLGFGHRTGSGFPGETAGKLVSHTIWYSSDVATLAYGYGIAVTALQLAQAYAVLACDGLSRPVTFLKLQQPPPVKRVIQASVAKEVVDMLESVVQGGTGTRASVPGYRVAGKTGTAYIASGHGYDKTKITASFVGLAPVSQPRLVVVVSIREPQGEHFGALVAAPVFAKVMAGALRILDIPPDDLKKKS